VSQNIAQPKANAARKQGIILSDVPQKVDTKARYLFYISGYIVEAGNTRPKNLWRMAAIHVSRIRAQ
jgi:hypothetical protein